MRPKARGLDQHDDPLGWLEESDPAGVMCSTDRSVCLFRTVPVALTRAAQLRADGISSILPKGLSTVFCVQEKF